MKSSLFAVAASNIFGRPGQAFRAFRTRAARPKFMEGVRGRTMLAEIGRRGTKMHVATRSRVIHRRAPISNSEKPHRVTARIPGINAEWIGRCRNVDQMLTDVDLEKSARISQVATISGSGSIRRPEEPQQTLKMLTNVDLSTGDARSGQITNASSAFNYRTFPWEKGRKEFITMIKVIHLRQN